MANGFDPLKTGNPTVDRVMQQLKAVLQPVIKSPMLGARLTDRQLLDTNFQNVEHNLGRLPVGWCLVSPWQTETVCEDAVANNPDPTRFLRVKASGTLQCAFLVF